MKPLIYLTFLPFFLQSCVNMRVDSETNVPISASESGQGNYQRNARTLEELDPPLIQIWEQDYVSLPNRGFTSYGDLLFFGTYNGHTAFIDSKTGDLKGKENFGDSCPYPPTIYGSILYQSFEAGAYGIIAYEFIEGETLWRVENLQSRSSPVVAENMVFHAALNGILSCYHYRSGELIWRNDLVETIRTSMALKDNLITVSTLAGRVIALDYTSGVVIWEHELNRPIISDPMIDGQRLYISAQDGQMTIFNLKDGTVLQTLDFSVPLYYPPVSDEFMLFIGSSDGILYAYDKENLVELWSFRGKGPVAATPLVSGSYLYLTTLGRKLYILDKTRGNLLQEIDLEGRPRSTPLIKGNTLFISREDNKVIAYAAKNDSI